MIQRDRSLWKFAIFGDFLALTTAKVDFPASPSPSSHFANFDLQSRERERGREREHPKKDQANRDLKSRNDQKSSTLNASKLGKLTEFLPAEKTVHAFIQTGRLSSALKTTTKMVGKAPFENINISKSLST